MFPMMVPSASEEEARLAALAGYHIIDSPPEAAFDRIVSLACKLLRVPKAHIAFVGRDRIWVKAACGEPRTEFPREGAPCDAVVRSGHAVAITDAGEGEFRFYAGAPLKSPDGYVIGAFCVFDRKPRPALSSADQTSLEELGGAVMDLLEARRREPGRVEAELAARARQQAAVAEIGQRALEGAGIPALLDGAAALVAKTLDVEFCKFLELLPDGQRLLLRAGYGWRPGLVGREIVDGRTGSHSGYTLLCNAPVIVEDFGSERRFERPRLLRDHGVASGVSVIVFGADRPFGVLGAYSSARRLFSRDDVNFLQSVAHMLSAAIERRKADAALEKSEATVRALIEAAPQGVIAAGQDGRIQLVNVVAERMFGYTREELIGMHVATLAPQLEGEEAYGVRKDGSRFPLEVSEGVLPEESGLLSIRLLSDISERKRAQEQSVFQASVLEQVRNAVIALDSDGRITYWNRFAESMYGWQAQEMLGRPLAGAALPETASAGPRQDGRWEGELLMNRKDGSAFPAFVVESELLDASGRASGSIIVSYDVSDRKRAEGALRAAHRNLETVVQTSPLAIVVIDRDGTVKLWNHAAERLFGWTAEEVIGRFAPSIPEEDQEPFQRLLENYRAGERLYGVERRRVRKDGTRIEVSLWTAPYGGPDGMEGTLGIFVDITRRKQLEERLRESPTLDSVCRIVEAQLNGALCSILLVDDAGERLRRRAAPSLPESYLRAMDGLTLGPEAACFAAAARSRQPVITPDIQADPRWAAHRETAAAHGLRACWAVPIASNADDVLGVFTVYAREPRPPSPNELQVIQRAVSLATNIVERSRYERALCDSEERYRRLFEENPLPMWLFGLDTLEVLAVNEAAVRHYGYSRKEFASMTFRDVLAPPDIPMFFERLARATDRVDLSGRWRHRKKDGSVLNVEASAFTLQFGGRWAALIQANDITRRLRAESARRESERKYRTLFEESLDAIVMIDPAGNVQDANQAAIDLFGYSRGELNEPIFNSLYGELRNRLEASGSLRDFEADLPRRDGSRITCLVTATVRRAKNGATLGYQAIIRDITARKQFEESLRELSGRLLQTRDEERRRLARELHDSTAQTLAAIAMNISLLEMELSADVDERAKKLLVESRALAGQCTRELRTISHLLHPPLLDELGLASALRSYVDGFASRSGVRLDLAIGDLPRLPKDVELAAFRIVQESLTNVHRHSGSLTARVRLEESDGEVTVEVADQGKGLPAHLLDERRELSSRVIGVGLPGMRERVRQLGGRFEVETGPQGTAIRVVLPVAVRQ